jgi:hypothetical protein
MVISSIAVDYLFDSENALFFLKGLDFKGVDIRQTGFF